MSETRPVVFLTDYGTQDDFVGICHGVMALRAPDVRVIDLDHGIPRQDIFRGALTLAQAVPFMPERSVFMAVVDPGVGSPRAPIAVRPVNAGTDGPRGDGQARDEGEHSCCDCGEVSRFESVEQRR